MVNKQKIAFIFPNFKLFERFSVTPHQPSLSLGYLAGILNKNDFSLIVIDAAAENLDNPQIVERIREFKPTYVGITTNIALAYAAISHALYIRRTLPNVVIMMGGPWATAMHKDLIIKRYADIVVLGEGERILIELMNINPKDYDALKNVQGISFTSPIGFHSTGRRPLIQDLGEIPPPKWEYFPKKGYQKSARAFPIYPLITSRGCPFDCKNCTKIVHGYQLRYRSIEDILEELDYLKKIGAREIAIEDDMFNLDLPRLKDLLRKIIQRHYKLKFQISNGIRADYVDLELAHLLRAAGTYRTALAIETGSQKVLEFLNKNLDLKVVPKAIKALKAAHIKVSGYFIIGMPVETYQSLIHTVYYANSLDLDIIVFLNLLVFPSTSMNEYIKSHAHSCEEQDKIHKVMNYVHTPIQFSTPQLNAKIVKKVQSYNLIRSFLNPRRFLRIIGSYVPLELTIQILKYFYIFMSKIVTRLSSKKT